jgi:hypothetical protein
MTSMFDYDDSINLAYNAKVAGKNLVAAKHDLLSKTGDFLFLAHSDREFAYRCQFVEEDIEKIAFRRLASVSDSKAKLVRAAYDEWQIRHANCDICKTAAPLDYQDPEVSTVLDVFKGIISPEAKPGRSLSSGNCDVCGAPVGKGLKGSPAYISTDGGKTMVDTSKVTGISTMPKGTPAFCETCARQKVIENNTDKSSTTASRTAANLKPWCKNCGNSNQDELVITQPGKMGDEPLEPQNAYCKDSRSCALRVHQQKYQGANNHPTFLNGVINHDVSHNPNYPSFFNDDHDGVINHNIIKHNIINRNGVDYCTTCKDFIFKCSNCGAPARNRNVKDDRGIYRDLCDECYDKKN